jgi:hypothetical protein
VAWELKPLYAPFPLARGLVRVLCSVIQIPMLTMSHARQELSLGGSITLQLIRDDDPRDVRQPFQQLAEEFLRCLLITPVLHENVEDISFLVNSSPEIVLFAIEREEYLVQVPLVARSRSAVTQLVGIGLAKLPGKRSRSGWGNVSVDLYHRVMQRGARTGQSPRTWEAKRGRLRRTAPPDTLLSDTPGHSDAAA